MNEFVLVLFVLGMFWVVFDLYFIINNVILIIRKIPPLALGQFRPEEFTLLIPAYNNASTVKRQVLSPVKSIVEKNGQLPFQVILVDSSTDKGEEGLRAELGPRWNAENTAYKTINIGNFVLLHLKNRQGRKGWALNEAIKNVQTKYFGILDSDWFLSLDEFIQTVKFMDANPVYTYAQMRWKAKPGVGNLVEGVDSVSSEYRHLFENSVRTANQIPITIHGSAVVIKTQDFKNVHGFDDSVLSEDVDLALKFMLNGMLGIGLNQVVSEFSPCDHFQQFFWQKARWAEGRSQLLRKYFLPILNSPSLSVKDKVFWFYYLCYFGRCVVFTSNLALIIFGLVFDEIRWVYFGGFVCGASLGLRYVSHGLMMVQSELKKTFKPRIFEPLSFYGIGLIYTYTFFKGLFLGEGQWHVVEAKTYPK